MYVNDNPVYPMRVKFGLVSQKHPLPSLPVHFQDVLNSASMTRRLIAQNNFICLIRSRVP
jgi:hypothetical protein